MQFDYTIEGSVAFSIHAVFVWTLHDHEFATETDVPDLIQAGFTDCQFTKGQSSTGIALWRYTYPNNDMITLFSQGRIIEQRHSINRMDGRDFHQRIDPYLQRHRVSFDRVCHNIMVSGAFCTRPCLFKMLHDSPTYIWYNPIVFAGARIRLYKMFNMADRVTVLLFKNGVFHLSRATTLDDMMFSLVRLDEIVHQYERKGVMVDEEIRLRVAYNDTHMMVLDDDETYDRSNDSSDGRYYDDDDDDDVD